MLKVIFALLIAVFLCVGISAADDVINSSSALTLQISTLPEAKLGFTQRFIFPFLQGFGPLTEGNNINLSFTAEVSPISLNGFVTAVWTPVAFFDLTAGGRIGTGWNIELFGNELRGIGLNRSAGGQSELSGSAFDGMLWKAQIGGAFQFDLAAIFPGDWNHIVARSYHEINYSGYTRAKAGESWYFENDFGENTNGFNYYGNFLLGYQMPLFLNMAALLAEANLYLYDIANRSIWGDDKLRWTFSGILNMAIQRKFEITLITQFRTMRNYLGAWEGVYYRDRTLDTSNPLRLQFFRVAAVMTYKF